MWENEETSYWLNSSFYFNSHSKLHINFTDNNENIWQWFLVRLNSFGGQFNEFLLISLNMMFVSVLFVISYFSILDFDFSHYTFKTYIRKVNETKGQMVEINYNHNF